MPQESNTVKISSESPVIVSDTMLEDPDDESIALGKPHDSVQAAMMLHKLSGGGIEFGQLQDCTSIKNGNFF